MPRLSHLPAALLLCGTVLTASASPDPNPKQDALRFFEGTTEGTGVVKIVMRKPYRSHSTGNGVIKADGSLYLVQRITDEGSAPKTRRWNMRRVGPGRYTGTMSDAVGPVDVEEVGGKYRFRFKMNGHLSAEEWMIPDPSGRSATTQTRIRKFGFRVATLEGVIRKVG